MNTGTRPSVLERAYDLARTGRYNGITPIANALLAEGYSRYDTLQMKTRSVRMELQKLCRRARSLPAIGPSEASLGA